MPYIYICTIYIIYTYMRWHDTICENRWWRYMYSIILQSSKQYVQPHCASLRRKPVTPNIFESKPQKKKYTTKSCDSSSDAASYSLPWHRGYPGFRRCQLVSLRGRWKSWPLNSPSNFTWQSGIHSKFGPWQGFHMSFFLRVIHSSEVFSYQKITTFGKFWVVVTW